MSSLISRRELLCRTSNGIGGLALARMLAAEAGAAPAEINPLSVKPQHLPRKAKHCIFLFMAGGVSQLDTFDYKPSLAKICRSAPAQSAWAYPERSRASSTPRIAPSPVRLSSRNTDNRGRWHVHASAEAWGVRGRSGVHPRNQGRQQQSRSRDDDVNTGSQFQGSPSVGSWVTYGLGSPNQNLAGVCGDSGSARRSGKWAAVWGTAICPRLIRERCFAPTGRRFSIWRCPKVSTVSGSVRNSTC